MYKQSYEYICLGCGKTRVCEGYRPVAIWCSNMCWRGMVEKKNNNAPIADKKEIENFLKSDSKNESINKQFNTMQLPEKIISNNHNIAGHQMWNIRDIAEKVNEIITYLEAKENAPMQYSGGTISIPAGTIYSETPTCNCGKSNAMCPLHGSIRTSHAANFHSETCTCGKTTAMCDLHRSVANVHVANFHSETEEPMFKAEEIEIVDDFPYLYITVKANGFETRAEAEAAREALLKLKK